jgi:serine phosphatase RsbU (regulator of sigma subunit)
MLKLDHFVHLPELDTFFERISTSEPGLIIVSGLEPRTTLINQESFLPSGRSTIFRVLAHEILAHLAGPAIAITQDKTVLRIPRPLRKRIQLWMVDPDITYTQRIAAAMHRNPTLLVIDRLGPETAPLALQAAQSGTLVLTQLDTVLWCASVARHILDLGALPGQLSGLSWVIAVQRLATLCPRCKKPAPFAPVDRARLRDHYSDVSPLFEEGLPTQSWDAPGCQACSYSGRKGHIACFDVLHAELAPPRLFAQPSQLSFSDYVLRLALLGYLSIQDALGFESEQLRRTYTLFTASEQALNQANASFQRKLVELEAANRVLEQRTEALISLQDISQALISSKSLAELAFRVCHHTCELCSAERAILYLAHPGEAVTVLAVKGWDPALVGQELDPEQVFGDSEPANDIDFKPANRYPPGTCAADSGKVSIGVSLSVPLIAQSQRVGKMIVHTRRKTGFAPGDIALFQAFANQAALAIQRADLIERLRRKIVQLETAQAELVQKERMEHELELARQVQQSVLPHVFPQVPGYTFAARSEPARQVGGDFYDVFVLDEDHVGLVIADVSDKGMPAALYMALARSLLLAEARRTRSPRAVLTSVNRLLLQLGNARMFVSMFYGIIQASTRCLIYTRAGHDRPLVLHDGTIRPLGGTGAVLGFLDEQDLRLSEEQATLAWGDRLMLYTDGLTDVLSSDDQLYGRDRLENLFRARGELCAEELVATIFDELAAYQGPAEQFDDMTVLIVQLDTRKAASCNSTN